MPTGRLELESASTLPHSEEGGTESLMEQTVRHDYAGVEGWLLFFCCVLTFIVPTRTIYHVSRTIPLISKTHSVKLQILCSVYVALFLGLAAFALVAGVRLWIQCAGAVRLAKGVAYGVLGGRRTSLISFCG